MILKAGERVRHHRGSIYEVICMAKCSETKKDIVVYKNIESDEIWVRPLSMFDDSIPKDWVYRFTKVE